MDSGDHEVGVGGDADDRSSSLSELEDRVAADGVDKVLRRSFSVSEDDDTEAETERLDESPQKLRKQTNVLVNSSTVLTSTAPIDSIIQVDIKEQDTQIYKSSPTAEPRMTKVDMYEDIMDQASDVSSLAESTEVSRPVSPNSISGQKRKRSLHDFQENGDDTVKSPKRTAGYLANGLINEDEQLEEPGYVAVRANLDMDMLHEDDEISKDSGEEQESLLIPVPQSARRAKRSTKKLNQDLPNEIESRDISPAIEDIGIKSTHAMARKGSIEEDDVEDVDPAENDAAARTEEELVKKKAAMQQLSQIEKHFATLRDRLFEERLMSFNEELDMLKQSNVTHPEYLAMMETIDQRRDDKVAQAKVRLRYKVQALQRKSIAERAQHHSQYMQTVREIRDQILEDANKEWYRIQRERRRCEEDETTYLYQYPIRRSQQISQQTAYNLEVSILSGIAKYRGFPAAPDIKGAKADEIYDDLRKMGITPQPVSLRVSTTLSNFPVQASAAEERFLEQNPWANPQHPAHQVRQGRPGSPFATPMAQRHVIDLEAPNGSASTIAEMKSAQASSVAPSPMGIDQTTLLSQRTQLSSSSSGPVQSAPKRRNFLNRENPSSKLSNSLQEKNNHIADPEGVDPVASSTQAEELRSPHSIAWALASNNPSEYKRHNYSPPFRDSPTGDVNPANNNYSTNHAPIRPQLNFKAVAEYNVS